MQPRVIVIGSSYMDYLCKTPKLPSENEHLVVNDSSIFMVPDGQGFLTAIAIMKTGGNCTLATALGKDYEGQVLYTLCKDKQVNTTLITVDSGFPTGKKIVMNTGLSHQTLDFPGANQCLASELILNELNTQPDAVVLYSNVDGELATNVTHICYEKNIPVILVGVGEQTQLPFQLLYPVDLFVVDDLGAKAYTGITPTGANVGLTCLLKLKSLVKAKYHIINMKERGALVFNQKQYHLVNLKTNPRPVDNAASNEVFSSALTVEYLRTNKDIDASIHYALGACEKCISQAGSIQSIPTDVEIRDYVSGV